VWWASQVKGGHFFLRLKFIKDLFVIVECFIFEAILSFPCTAMQLYKVSFIKNKILSCAPADPGIQLKGDMYYEYNNGKLIFAIIAATSEQEAMQKANELARTVSSNMQPSNNT
jgi:hypothetical protein